MLPEHVTFHKRVLPSPAVPFSSPAGKALFADALTAGTAECYFPLSEQFITQAEPAYCGITSLAMVLNTLGIDPRRTWKGRWRWYALILE
jgi:glutathione gamma-glutamylcysteinyltransferase